MKKALLFVLVAVMAFAMAAPAFAAPQYMDEDEFVAWGGESQIPNIWSQSTAEVTVLHALEVGVTGRAQFGRLAPGETGTGSFTLTVKSNDAFHKSFGFMGATPDAVLAGAKATLTSDGVTADYVLGTTLDHAASLADVETLNLSLTPDWEDAVGVHTNVFQIGVWQD